MFHVADSVLQTVSVS